MKQNSIFIGLGGNIGNRLELINQAKKLIKLCGCKIIEQSSIYETAPWGFDAGQNFLNQIVKIETILNPYELMEKLEEIELILGRTRKSDNYESRTMDLDILFFKNEIISEKNLTIPHPRLHLRKFVLEPMNEIAPRYVHPKLNSTIHELLLICPDKSECVKI